MKTFARYALAGLLAVAGVAHLTKSRRGFRKVVPDWAVERSGLTKDEIVVGSGVAELGLAAALVALPRERRTVGWVVAAFFGAVFPGNYHQWKTKRSAPMLDTDTKRFVRLLLQPVLILWALWSTSD